MKVPLPPSLLLQVTWLRLTLGLFLFFGALSVSAQTVTTDKDDYAPGETAIIRGTGWTLDQFVAYIWKKSLIMTTITIFMIPK